MKANLDNIISEVLKATGSRHKNIDLHAKFFRKDFFSRKLFLDQVDILPMNLMLSV